MLYSIHSVEPTDSFTLSSDLYTLWTTCIATPLTTTTKKTPNSCFMKLKEYSKDFLIKAIMNNKKRRKGHPVSSSGLHTYFCTSKWTPLHIYNIICTHMNACKCMTIHMHTLHRHKEVMIACAGLCLFQQNCRSCILTIELSPFKKEENWETSSWNLFYDNLIFMWNWKKISIVG